MVTCFENEWTPIGNHRLPIMRLVGGFLLVALSSVYLGESVYAQSSDTGPGACCVSSRLSVSSRVGLRNRVGVGSRVSANGGTVLQCEVAVFSNGIYSCGVSASVEPFGGSCSVGACVLPDGRCIVADQMCTCPSLGGKALGGRTTCTSGPRTEACCGTDPLGIGDSSSCEDLTIGECEALGGVPAGVGTNCSLFGMPQVNVCSALHACCTPISRFGCFNDNLYQCVGIGGDLLEIGTNCTFDMDFDVISNPCDNCPSVANNDQIDTDKDGVGDVCDNCPTISNADQADANGNGVGDLCEN